jgi:hypothetical protein
MTQGRHAMPSKMITIFIQQLDGNGNVYRIFTRYVHEWDLDRTLAIISRGYNMDHTRVTHS